MDLCHADPIINWVVAVQRGWEKLVELEDFLVPLKRRSILIL
jgi:hypothetical protein